LVHSDRVENLGELVSVFGLVDILRVSAEDTSFANFLEFERDVLRQLATD
jgi:hypothetical protein